MKNKKIILLIVILGIAGAGVAVFFIFRPRHQELLPQQFAELPEKPKLIAEFHHGPKIYSVAFSPTDPSLIAFGDQYDTIKLWNRNNTEEPVKILNHPGKFVHIGFSPTGELLASASHGKLVLWDVASGMEINTLESSRDFAFTPDGNQLATVRNGVKLWNIRNPKKITEIATLPFNEAHRANGWACAVDISSDGKWIAAGYSNGTVNVWDLQTRQLVKSLETSLFEMDFLKFSPNNKYMVSGGHERDLYSTYSAKGFIMWELPSWQRKGEVLRGPVENLVFSSDGKMCVSHDNRTIHGRGVEIWSTANGAPITFLRTEARDVSFSQDGKILATGGEDGILRLWELTPQQLELATIPTNVVKIIYFLPKDKEPTPNITEKLDKLIREVQDFYADEMERHGFGRKTFTFETDENGNAKVYFYKGNKTKIYDLSNDIWLGVIDDISDLFSVIWNPDIVGPNLDIAGLNETFRYPSGIRHSVKDNISMREIEGITPGILVSTSVRDLRKSIAYSLKRTFGLPYNDYKKKPNILKRLFTRVNDKMPWGKKWAKLSRLVKQNG